jgi:hypothetical protein
MVRLATNPPAHWLDVEYVTWQARPAGLVGGALLGGGVVGGALVGGGLVGGGLAGLLESRPKKWMA